jgi:hypothetical protein
VGAVVPHRVLKTGPEVESSNVGTAEHFRWLEGIIKATLVLNLADAIFTLVWVRAGLAREANVLMRDLVNDHAVLFVVVKLALVTFGSWVLWRRRDRPAAAVGVFLVFLVYYAILLYHLRYSSLLLRRL